jgi:hypothetical protein
LHASLCACLPAPQQNTIPIRIGGVSEVTPGLSGSRVLRVELTTIGTSDGAGGAPGADRRSVILKVPDWGTPTGIAPRDPWVGTREVHFYESGLAARLPHGLRAPRLLGLDHVPPGPGTWLWTEDVATALAVAWNPDRAIAAARRAARLHALFSAERAALERQPWLEREGYAAHAHHLPAAHRNLDRLAEHARWSPLIAPDERAALHRALDLTDWAKQEMGRLPPTLVHGDFHIRNLGWDPDGTLVAIDWAHVGIAPPAPMWRRSSASTAGWAASATWDQGAPWSSRSWRRTARSSRGPARGVT